MTDKISDPIEYSKLSLSQFIQRAPIGTLVVVIFFLIGAGFALGKYIESRSEKNSNDLLRALLAAQAPPKSPTASASTTPGRPSGQNSTPIDAQATATSTTAPCEILAKGNALLQANKHEQAIAAYSAVEQADRIGKQSCTESTYASLGVAYTAWAKEVVGTDSARALELTRKANLYHRAAIVALWCSRLNNCKYSEDFWSDNRFFQ